MTLDKTLFTSLGINLPASQQAAFERHFMQELQERVGLAIIDLLDDDQASELIKLQETADATKVSEWVKAYVPDYEAIVRDEFDILMSEVAENSAAIAN